MTDLHRQRNSSRHHIMPPICQFRLGHNLLQKSPTMCCSSCCEIFRIAASFIIDIVPTVRSHVLKRCYFVWKWSLYMVIPRTRVWSRENASPLQATSNYASLWLNCAASRQKWIVECLYKQRREMCCTKTAFKRLSLYGVNTSKDLLSWFTQWYRS